MWEAVAEYKDGFKIRRLFEASNAMTDNEQQYFLECWLLDVHEGCTWYSVNWINEM